MSLSHAFKVRLCNFKATGVQSRGHPPFCIRGNFDGKPFNTEYFNSASMSPMWALDTRFDFHTPNLDVLGNKYLLLECYGADIFIGMCRVDLRSLATGPTAVELSLREGHRVAGTVSFEAFFEHVTNTTLQLTHVSLQHVASRGPAENGNPCPYISLGFSETGCTLESMVAPSATSPEWDRLPPLHKRCTYHELNDTRLIFELKHARNGFSPGVSDPLMASFDLHLGTLPIEIGRDSYIPVRIMVHSTAQYAFPFSTPLVATLEVRNAPKLVQLRGGLLTDSGVVGGIQPVGAAGLNVSTRPISPRRVTLPIETSAMRSPPRVHSAPALPSVSHSLNVSRAAPIATAAPIIEASEVRSADIDLLDEVGERQSVLLSRVQSRLQDVSRRRADVIARLDELVGKEEERVEATKRRKASLEADLRTALAERDRIEEALRQLQMRREEEQRLSADQAADRERMRRDLEEEQREVEVLQNRVTMLRDEMERHLLEEQERYAQRVREAEDARRRAQQDAEEFAMIEARLAEAEARAAKQQRDHDVRHQARLQSALSPSRHR